MLKAVGSLFIFKTENEAINDWIIRDIKNLFKQEEDYYKLVIVGNFYRNNYIEYESNGDRNKTLSIEENLNKIRLYLKDIINNLNVENSINNNN